MAEMRTNVTVAPALGEIPSVEFDVDGTRNVCITLVTGRGDEVALWFDDDAHLMHWMRHVLVVVRRRNLSPTSAMLPEEVVDERPPAPVDEYTFGAGRG